jgi:hypothetical protein
MKNENLPAGDLPVNLSRARARRPPERALAYVLHGQALEA